MWTSTDILSTTESSENWSNTDYTNNFYNSNHVTSEYDIERFGEEIEENIFNQNDHKFASAVIRGLTSSLPVYIPSLIVIGLIGNLITIVVIYASQKLRGASTNHYLAVVSISDSVFLIGLIASALDKLNIVSYEDQSPFHYRLSLYLMNVAACVSSWSVAAMAVERWAVITQRRFILTLDNRASVRRAVKLLLCLVPLPMVANLFIFCHSFGLPFHQNWGVSCVVSLRLNMWLNMLDMFLVFASPFVIVVTVNILVFLHVSRAKTMSTSILKEDDRRSTLRRNTTKSTVIRQRQHLAAVLFVVPVAHIILNAPSYILRAVHFQMSLTGYKLSPPGEAWLIVVTTAAVMLHYLNFAVNFITYTAASSKFRKTLKTAKSEPSSKDGRSLMQHGRTNKERNTLSRRSQSFFVCPNRAVTKGIPSATSTKHITFRLETSSQNLYKSEETSLSCDYEMIRAHMGKDIHDIVMLRRDDV